MKHLLKWQNVVVKSGGKLISLPVPNEIDSNYRGTLLSRIMAMKKATPISLEKAILLMVENEHAASAAGRKGADPGHLFWFSYHFVEWLSDLGYHVELTGDEFEPAIISDKVT